MKKNITDDIDYKTDLKDFPDDSRALFELLASEADDLGVVEQQMYNNKLT
jgi:hypothetical protein